MQDTEEEEKKRKTEEVRRIQEEREDHLAEVEEEDVCAIPYEEEAAAREVGLGLERALAPNGIFLSQSPDGQIAVLLQNCSTNWQQMIESGDILTVFKTLETYNAIHRIPVLLVNENFTMNADSEEIKGMTALHMSAVKGKVEMVRLLLLHPSIDVNAVDHEIEWTPLYIACYYDHVEVVKVLLLNDRVDVNKDGWTPLHAACYRDHFEVFKVLLLDARVDVNKTDN
eukprot:scaffold7439_cov168-Ochromonas_danica.AAC.12